MQGYAQQWMFPNGLGVSIIFHKDSEGNERGLFEGALLVRRKGFGVGEYRIAETIPNLTFRAVDEILLAVYKASDEVACNIISNDEQAEKDFLRELWSIRSTYLIMRWTDRMEGYRIR